MFAGLKNGKKGLTLPPRLLKIGTGFRDVAQPGSASRPWREGRDTMYVYILYSSSLERYYVGITDDLENRLEQHNSGKGNYTSKGMPWKLVRQFECENRAEAVRLEKKIKSRGIKRYLQDNNYL